MAYTRGSEWRKWDLHIHTPASYQWQGSKRFSEMTTQEEKDDVIHIVNEAIESSNVDLFTIMDYWTFDGYQALRKHRSKEGVSSTKTVLPGIELRVVSPTEHRLNMHFILSDQLSDQKLNNFKASLKIMINGRACPLSDEALVEFAASLDNSKARLHGFGPITSLTEEQLYLLGAKTAEVTQESICDALQTSPGNAFILMPWDTYHGLEPLEFKEHTASSEFFMKLSHIFESRKQDVYDVFVGNKTEHNERFFDDFQDAIGRPKPVVSGSDAHRVTDYGNFPNDKATWVKADPTFEGLRQIIHEPADRVRIQGDTPEEKAGYHVIQAVRYIDPTEETFSSEWIPLNPNLNTVIGGKSSGKSMLLHYIARTLDPEQVRSVASEISYEFENISGFDFEVQWQDGEVSKLSDPETLRRITYVPQLYIYDLADSDSNIDLRRLILSVLLQNDDLKSKYDRYTKDIEKIIREIQQEIIRLKKLKMDRQTAVNALHELGDRTGVRKEIEKLSWQIEELNRTSNFTDHEQTVYFQLNEKISECQERIQTLDRSMAVLMDVKRYMIDYESETAKNLRNQMEDSVQRVSFDQRIPQELLSIFGNIRSNIARTLGEGIAKITELITGYGQELDQTNFTQHQALQALGPLMAKFANQERVQELKGRLHEQSEILTKLEQQRAEVNIIDKRYKEQINDVLSLYESMFEKYKILARTFQGYTTVSSDLSMTVELSFNTRNFEEKFLTLLNRRKRLEAVFEHGFEGDEYKFTDSEHGIVIEQIFRAILDEKVTTKSNVDQDNLLVMLLGDYFDIHYDLIYKGDSMTKMSPGKRGLVLLQLLLHLSNSKHPILLDQPEDNLDNRTISAELQGFIKAKKIQRQIIMVTHNANLVVLADAEEVIVANQSGQQVHKDNEKFRFEYVSGALECNFTNLDAPGILQKYGIRQHVCEILEGGAEAFMKREEKYGL